MLNVNNKITLGFRVIELTKMIEESRDSLGLSYIIINWAVSDQR